MGQIRVMPGALANQIAAGEVVERPASCVKELVENAIDAGAKNVYVAIEEGGISAITVQDDGSGMDEEDAMLAFSRHATSKLTSSRDLFRVMTLGFRGEALASIAAVAKVKLQTRQARAAGGIEVQVEGTDVVSPAAPVGMAPGTRIEVRNLFFNTPARLKYLRSVNTEQARCVEVVQKAALGRPDIAFQLETNGHVSFRTQGSGKLQEVAAAMYGVGEAKQFLSLQAQNADYRLTGLIGRPTQSRASRSYAHVYINGRPIRNYALHQAVVAGYQGRLMVNRHPMYVLHLEMDPVLVDVNIHPHKAEVRFSEEQDVARLVQQAVKEALDAAFLVPNIQFSGNETTLAKQSRGQSVQSALEFAPRGSSSSYRASWRAAPSDNRWSGAGEVRDAVAAALDTAQTPDKRTAYKTSFALDLAPGAVGESNSSMAPNHRAPFDVQHGLTGEQSGQDSAAQPSDSVRSEWPDLPPESSADDADGSSSAAALDRRVDETSVPKRQDWRLRPIGQTLGMYILADDGENLYIIDQHAAHERVLYERFSKRMSEREIHQIALLTPLSLTLTPSQRAALSALENDLSEMGLEFSEFGGDDVLLRTVPDIWENLDAAQLVEELIGVLTEASGAGDAKTVLRDTIVSRACKAAIKANYYLSEMEMNALCEALSDLEDPFHCPHGRPVFLQLSSRDLEKGFRRIV